MPVAGATEAQRIALSMLNDVRLSDVNQLAATDAGGRRGQLTALLETQNASLPKLLEALTRRYFSIVGMEPTWARARSRTEQ